MAHYVGSDHFFLAHHTAIAPTNCEGTTQLRAKGKPNPQITQQNSAQMHQSQRDQETSLSAAAPTPNSKASGSSYNSYYNNLGLRERQAATPLNGGTPKKTSNKAIESSHINNASNTSNISSNENIYSSADAAAGLDKHVHTHAHHTRHTNSLSQAAQPHPNKQLKPNNPQTNNSSSAPDEMEALLANKYHHLAMEEPLVLFGYDLSGYNRTMQFLICAGGVFLFTLLYGYLQELLAVQLFNRDLALFLASVQFLGYTFWSFVLRTYINMMSTTNKANHNKTGNKNMNNTKGTSSGKQHYDKNMPFKAAGMTVPLKAYVGISLVRALDLGMTNSAMKFINYPAKTLVKSSRVIFTMLIGVVVSKKRYSTKEVAHVVAMVLGLAVFLHADASSAAIFQPLGVIMLIVSLICDGFITNWSEIIMRQYSVGQDEYIYRLYSIAFVAITAAAWINGEISRGYTFLSVPGTLAEIEDEALEPTWSVRGKLSVLALFGTTGFFGSSAAAAITKHFGALPMSITSVARKATTLFLSFALFGNDCSMEHVGGMIIFIAALLAKAVMKKKQNGGVAHSVTNGGGNSYDMDYSNHHYARFESMTPSISMVDLEMGGSAAIGVGGDYFDGKDNVA